MFFCLSILYGDHIHTYTHILCDYVTFVTKTIFFEGYAGLALQYSGEVYRALELAVSTLGPQVHFCEPNLPLCRMWLSCGLNNAMPRKCLAESSPLVRA